MTETVTTYPTYYVCGCTAVKHMLNDIQRRYHTYSNLLAAMRAAARVLVSHLWQQRVVVFHLNSRIRLESVLLTTMVSRARMCIEYWRAFFEWFRFLLAAVLAAAGAVTVRVFTRTWTVGYIHSRMCSMWFSTFGATCAIVSLRG